MIPRFGAVRSPLQMCWVVPDLEAAIASWIAVQGVGPWFWFESVEFDHGIVAGQPARFPGIRAAIAQAGETQIELVAHKDDGPSFFCRGMPAGRAVFHDVAWLCEDFDAELATYIAGGAEIAFLGTRDDLRTCWLDTTPTLGFMTQLTERSAATERAFAAFRQAALGWDGSDPIRRLG